MGLRFTFQREGGGEPFIYNVATVSQYTIDKLDKGSPFYEETFVIDSESPKIPSTAYNHFIIDKGYPWSAGSNSFFKTEWTLLTRSGCLALNNIVTIENGIDYDTTYPIAPKKFLMTKQTEKFICANGNYVVAKQDSSGWVNYEVYDKNNSLLKTFDKFNFGRGPGYAGYVIWATTSYTDFLNPDANMYYINTQASNRGYIYIKTQRSTNRMDPFRYALITSSVPPEPEPEPDPENPYDKNPDPSKPSFPDGDAGQGNNGTWNDPDDPIDIPENPPFFGAGSSGFLTMYAPSWAQLNNLASFLWTEEFFNQIVKLWADPMQVIMGLNILPVQIPKGPNTEIMVGNVSSGVQAPIASQQYVYADMGSIELKPFYGSYMDFAPYTKITLVLPFIGAKELVTDEVMGKVINVSYRIDILTGACIAYVKCGQSVLYQFSGNCGENIPITSASYTEMLTSYTKLAGDAAAMAVTGGGAAGGNVISSSINAIASIKPNISHTGTLASSCGAMGVLTPYIIKTKPNICMPGGQYKIEGLPSFVETAFSKCKGYTQVHSTRLQGIPATDEELEMIYNQLREGVVF